MAQRVPLETIVARTFDEIGLVPNFDTMRIDDRGASLTTAIQDASGLNDVFIMNHWGLNGHSRPVRPIEYSVGYLLRGLLRADCGWPVIKLGGETPDNIGATPERSVQVQIFSSPAAVNQAQAALGRQPGVDAFKLVRHPKRGRQTAGTWTKGFSQYEVIVSRLGDWIYAEHDLNPADHVQSWIATPPAYCAGIARHADELKSTYGWRIHAPKTWRPDSVDHFARAIDDLSGFTRSIFRAVSRIDDPGVYSMSPLLNLRDEISIAEDSRFSHGEYTMYVDRNAEIFRRLGIIAMECPEKETPAALRTIAGAYAAHVAGLFLRLEQVKPRPHDNERRREARTKLWHAIENRYGGIEAPKNALLVAS